MAHTNNKLKGNGMSDLIKNEDLAKTIIEQQEEIKALKAQIDTLSTAAWEIHQNIYFIDDDDEIGYVDDKFVMNLAEAINKTPQHCLDDVRADAELSGARGFKQEMMELTTPINQPLIDGVFIVYASKIRNKYK